MIAVVATLRAKPGSEDAFERAFEEMAAGVHANEPGAKLYQLTRSKTVAGLYKVLEIYAGEAALEEHRTSDHYREGGRKLRDLVAGPPEIELLDTVG